MQFIETNNPSVAWEEMPTMAIMIAWYNGHIGFESKEEYENYKGELR